MPLGELIDIDQDKKTYEELTLLFNNSNKTIEEKYNYIFSLTIINPDLISPFLFLGKEFVKSHSLDTRERNASLACIHYVNQYKLLNEENSHNKEYLYSCVIESLRELVKINSNSPIAYEQFEIFATQYIDDNENYVIKGSSIFNLAKKFKKLDPEFCEFLENISLGILSNISKDDPKYLSSLYFRAQIYKSQGAKYASEIVKEAEETTLKAFIEPPSNNHFQDLVKSSRKLSQSISL